MRRFALVLLAVCVAGCGDGGPGYRVERPDGWQDETREYGDRFEDGTNELAPAWAELRVDEIWSDASRRTSLIMARAPNASAISLHRLAGRMIELSEGGIPNFRVARPPVRTEVDDADAVIYDYTGSPPFGLVKVRIALIRHGGDTHMVSMTSTPSAFAAESPRFADVLDSWEWS